MRSLWHLCVRRLQSELMSLMMSGDAGLSAFPDGDNIFQWTGTITGGDGTVRVSANPAFWSPEHAPRTPPRAPAARPRASSIGGDRSRANWQPCWNGTDWNFEIL